MLVVMFDTSYKNMKCIQDFVGNSIIVEIVVEYNVEIMALFYCNYIII